MSTTDAICAALLRERTIDITTTGRYSGATRRIETWFHQLDGHIYLTGSPGKRDWYANLLRHPRFTFHLKQSVQADLSAEAVPITKVEERRGVFVPILERLGHSADLDAWMSRSPLVRVRLDVDCPELAQD